MGVSSALQRLAWMRWVVPVAAVALATGVRLGLRDWVDATSPFLLFLAAVMAAAAAGGLGPGLLATALGAISAGVLIGPPYEHAWPPLPAVQGVPLALFLFEGAFISGLCGTLHRAVRNAETHEREARQLEREVLEIGDAERKRIGHDLHDNLGQQLLGVSLLSKSVQRRLADAGNAEAASMERIRGLVGESIAYTRDLARRLSAVTIASDGLHQSLLNLCAGTERIMGVTCRLSADESLPSPPPIVVEHLYRIAQEAISNAVRHGRATRIDIELARRDGRQALTIRDNGVGFGDGTAQPSSEPTDDDASRGIGLRVMRYRAAVIGGTLSIQDDDGPSEPPEGDVGRGAVVVCSFPVG